MSYQYSIDGACCRIMYRELGYLIDNKEMFFGCRIGQRLGAGREFDAETMPCVAVDEVMT